MSGRSRVLHGLAVMLPLIPGHTLLGVAFGAAARLGGLDAGGAILMSAAVGSATAQFAGLPFLSAGPLALFANSLFLSLRFLTMSLAIAPRLRARSRLARGLVLATLSDGSFAFLARTDASVDAWWLVGAWLGLYAAWVAGTAIGALIAPAVPSSWEVLANAFVAVIFVVFAVGACRSRETTLAAIGGAGISLLLTAVLPSSISSLLAATIVASALAALTADGR